MVGDDDETPIRYVVIDEEDELSVQNDPGIPSSFSRSLSQPVEVTSQPLQDPEYGSLPIAHCPSYQNEREREAMPIMDESCVRCPTCDIALSTSDFLTHVRSCKLRKQFKCDACNEEFNKEHNLKVHSLKMHTVVSAEEDGKFRCVLCSKVYARSSAFYGHLSVHAINDTLSCAMCNEEYEYQALLNHHMRTQHLTTLTDDQPTVHICRQCSVVIADKEALEKHMQLHRKINEVILSKDVFYFGSVRGIVVEFFQPRGVTLLWERNVFMVDRSMKHEKRNKARSNVEKRHKCHRCHKSFAKNFELLRHFVVHTKERRFVCERCGKKFSQRSSLSQHMQTHVEHGAFRHKCTLCASTFSQAGNLRRHVMLLHPADVSSRTVFRCPHCTCVFNSVQPLQVHMRKRHHYDASGSHDAILENSGLQETSASDPQQNARNRRRLVCCSICGKAFGKCSDLVRHYRIHSGSRPFSCNRCEKSFSLKSSLKLHLENHVREDNIDNYYTSARCPVCMKQLASAASLRRHMKLHTRTLEHCTTCSQSFATKKALEKHGLSCALELARAESGGDLVELMAPTSSLLSNDVPSVEPYHCRTCTASFTTLRALKEHINRHTGIKPHVCRSCHKSFFSLGMLLYFAQLKSHSSIHSSGALFKCSFCERAFRRRVQLRDHMRKLHRRDSKTFEPEECNRIALETNELNELGRAAERFIGTELAGEVFDGADVQQSNVPNKTHQLQHFIKGCVIDDFSPVEDAFTPIASTVPAVRREPRCPVCLFTFHSESALCSHLTNLSTDTAHKFASFTCSVCHESIIGSTQFGEHLSSAHKSDFKAEKVEQIGSLDPRNIAVSDEKVHSCDSCGRSFKKPSDLLRHKRIHTGEKPFSCGICERAFRVKSTLYQHMKVHDNRGEKVREMCSVCGKCYCSKSSLKQHLLMIHAQQRPFKCTVDLCDQYFGVVRSRDAHVQRCHKTTADSEGTHQPRIEDNASWTCSAREQFIETAAQLAPSSKNVPTIQPSLSSAFSRPTHQNEWSAATNIALRLSPHARPGNVEVHISVVSGIPPEDGSIIIELSMLRPLSSGGILLKIPVSLPFLTPGSSIAVDAHRLLIMLSKTENETLVVPLNVSTEVTNCPVAVFGALPTSEVTLQPAAFATSCAICSQYFLTSEESEAHFASEDHETAELLSLSETNHQHAVGLTLNAPLNQYLSLPSKNVRNEVCKLCLGQFENHESLLAHIRRVHERDSTDVLARRDLFTRRRTLN
uniref:C2H2-type domain-containing protein n=1 Tax=Ascaris lumbricoides TaxID=6252 RepID=A0A9J2P2Z2_ASCLU